MPFGRHTNQIDSSEQMMEFDVFGFPIDVSPIFPGTGPKPRRCGCCRQVGHDCRTCPAVASAGTPCLISSNFGGKQRLNCLCKNCIEYRKYNYPTPEKAAWRLRKQKEEKMRQYPKTKLYNLVNDIIYLYEFTENGTLQLLNMIDIYKSLDFQLGKALHKGEVGNIVVTSRDFGRENVYYENIHPKFILETITIEYGLSFEYDISDYRDSYMKTIEKDKKQWMKTGLKLKYLLDQLDRLGASNNPNLECIMDMIQDVEIPEHGEFDKNDAGVPSVFTNTVSVTGINE